MRTRGISDAGIRRIASRVHVAGEESEDPRIREELIQFLKENPNPEDELLHEWAESRGYDVHEVEDHAYAIATEHLEEKTAAEQPLAEIKYMLSQEAPEELYGYVIDLLIPELERQIEETMTGERDDIDPYLYEVADLLKESSDKWGDEYDYPESEYAEKLRVLRGLTGG